jgi:hypothetical protein
MHYMWNAGALLDYDSTIAFHNCESIRIVNSWLGDTAARTTGIFVRLMVTLCVAEVSAVGLDKPSSSRETIWS